MRNCYIYGHGICGERFAKIAEEYGWIVEGFIDNNNYYRGGVTVHEFAQKQSFAKPIVFIAAFSAKNYFEMAHSLDVIGYVEDENYFDATDAFWNADMFFYKICKGRKNFEIKYGKRALETLFRSDIEEYLSVRRILKNYLPDVFPVVIKELFKYVRHGDNVADLGAGYGLYADLILEAAPDAYITMVENNINRLSHLNEMNKRYFKNAIKIINTDVEDIPMAANSYNVVLSISVLTLVCNLYRALEEMCRILMSGGYIMILLSNIEHPGIIQHYHKHGLYLNSDATVNEIEEYLLSRDVKCVFKHEFFLHHIDYGYCKNVPLTTFLVFCKNVNKSES